MVALVFKVAEVAAMLQCGPRSIYRLIENGELRAVNIGRLIRMPESAVAEFLSGQSETPAVDMQAGASVVPIANGAERKSYG